MALSGPSLLATIGPNATSDPDSGSYTPTDGAIQILTVWFDQDALPTISDTLGGTWTLIIAGYRDDDGQFAGYGCWYQEAGASPSARTVTVTMGASAHGGWIDEWTGYNTSDPIGASAMSNFNSGASNPIQQAVTTEADDSAVIGGLGNWDSTSGSTADTGDTLDHESQVLANMGGMTGHVTTVTTAGSYTLGFNRSPQQERGHICVFELKAAAGGTDATVNPAAIACTVALPASTLSVGAAPAAIGAVGALPAPGVGVGVSPAPAAAVAALPQAAVGVGVAPAVLAAVAALPLATAGESGTGATVTPDPIAAVAALPAPAVGVGAAPAPVASVVALPQPAVGVGVVPTVLAALVALPLAQPRVDQTVTPAVVAAVAAIHQPAVGVGVTPAVIQVLVEVLANLSVGDVAININPAGPLLVGAIVVNPDAVAGATSGRRAIVGGIS
jgi:hypothetical protein